MERLLEYLGHGMKNDIGSVVKKRIREFEIIGKSSDVMIFQELCFCILTANFSAERGIKIQEAIGKDFLTLSEEELARKLKKLGHRYPNTRARYIVEARRYINSLRGILNSFKDEQEAREWLVKNIKGIGYKEASHFLRNIGFKNLAIIDFHILDVLAKYGLVTKPRHLTKRKYFEIETVLRKIAEKLGMNLAELDLYLWYMETKKVLK
ncbi:MAG: N-glycosylase/DNA lyase [Candidatus Aenigmarchaeota archaeon]|nr:N-glycosylase/DNA lyase [Candidatus Aenigmarchaeota archaeon]